MDQEPKRRGLWNQSVPILPAFLSITLVVLGLGVWLRNEMIRNNYALFAAPQGLSSDAQNSVTIVSPSGGELLTKGESLTVEWLTSGIPTTFKEVNLFLMRQLPDGGQQQFALAKNVGNTGSAQVTVPDSIPAGMYKLKVRVLHLKGLPNLVEDTSDEVFQIVVPDCDAVGCDEADTSSDAVSVPAPVLYNDEVPCPPGAPLTNCVDVTSPNGDEIVDRSQPFTITWDYQGIPDNETVIVYLSRITGTGLQRQDYKIYDDSAKILVSKKSHTFTIPGNLPNGMYKVRLIVKEIKGSLPNIVVGYSNNPFEIMGEAGGTGGDGGGGGVRMSKNEQPCPPNPGYQNCIDVLTPNGGETIDRANAMQVTWKYEGIPSDEIVMVFLRRITQQGQQDYTINKNVPIASGSYTFYVPDNLPNGSYKMKLVVKEIKGTLPNLVFGYSDKAFTITGTGTPGGGGTSQVITVDTPAAGDTVYKGDYIPVVKWRSLGIAPDNHSITIFLQYDEEGPNKGKKFFIENKLLNDGIEENVYIPVRDRILPGKYRLGIRAEKVGTTKLPTGLSGVVSLKDGTGIAGGGVFAPTIKRYTCEQVRDGQAPNVDSWPWPDGTVGHPATQFDSRRMVEARQFDCAPRAISWAVDLLSDAPVDEKTQKEINEHLRVARWWHAKAMARYMKDTVKAVDSGKPHNHFIGTGEYAWIYIPNIFQELRRAFSLYTPALQQYLAGQPECLNGSDACKDQMMRLVGIRFNGGKINDTSMSYSPTPKSNPFKIPGQKDVDLLGGIGGVMSFEPLTTEQLALLDETQRLHTRWAQAAMKEGDHEVGHADLMQYILDHHDAHIALEQTAVSLNQQVLMTIPDHGLHGICTERTHEEMRPLIQATEDTHQKWVAAVKAGKFAGPDGAWQLGLLHSRAHVILGNCPMNDKNLPVFGIDIEFPVQTFDVAPDFDIRKAPKK